MPSSPTSPTNETTSEGAIDPIAAWSIRHAPTEYRFALSEDVAGAYHAVVLGAEGERLLVAVPDPHRPGLHAALQSAARRPVRLIAAGRGEIESALAGRPRSDVVATLDALGLSHLLDATARSRLRQAEEEGDDALLASLSNLPDGWGAEVAGLLDGAPHLDTAAQHLQPFLQLLLPPELRGDQPAAWAVEDDTVVLVCPLWPSDGILEAVERWSGYRVRCVLADPELLRDLHRIQPRRDEPPSFRSRLKRRMPSFRLTPDSATRGLRAVARQLDLPDDAVARRLGGDEGRDAPLPEPDPAALALLPLAICRSLGVVPLRAASDDLHVAVSESAAQTAGLPELIGHLTGRRVRIGVVTHSVQQRLLARASSRVAGRVPAPGATRVSAARSAARDLTDALEASVEGTEQRLQALSVLHEIPWVRLDRYATNPDALAVLTVEQMRSLRAVPLRRDGSVLWVAISEPDEARLRTLAGITRLAIRPVLASAEALNERLARLESVTKPAALELLETHPVLGHVQARGLATKTDLMRLVTSTEEPVDAALDTAGILSAACFCEVAAQVSGLAPIDLRLQGAWQAVVDALGERTVRQVWTDPVDPSLVHLLPAESMETLAVLPVRREDGELIVAVADPFDRAVRDLVGLLTVEHPKLVVAPRPAILSALRRARGHIPLGDRLLTRGIVTAPQLAEALQLHRRTGVRLGQALLSLDMVTQEQLAYVLAEQRDLPFFHLGEMQPDDRVAHLLSEETERRLAVLPLYQVGETLTVATPDPLNQGALDEVVARTDLEVEPVVCTENDLEAALERLYRDQYLEKSTSELVVRTPDESASVVITTGQRVFMVIAALLLVVGLLRSPGVVGILFTGAASAFYLAFSLYRSYLIWRALSHDLEVPVTADELAALKDEELRIYTILVPLYKEASVLPTLLLGLSKLDYPATKLDVKLLLEEDDVETRDAVDRMTLPSYVRPVVVPAAQPRCKPKACNYGLIHARGEYVVIYDAEDVPDPDQLKKVVAAFRKSGPDMVCLQAKLNYYNGRQNLLTSWFTTEYSMWFDLFLPGLDATQVPIPLGGTSNHFLTAKLREVGAWDPYNVTEDADLGVRLYRRGWKTGIVDSTTLEEANSEVYNWLRQRSRWVKGYIQTYLVHMRHPLRLWKALGTRAFFSFQMVVGGTFLAFLLNPIFWTLTALWYLAHAGFIRAIFPGPVYYMGMLSLALGNFAFIYLNVAGCLRRGHYYAVKHALVSPLYWALMSMAAWKGFLQLWTNPFYWEKTTHGLYRRPAKTSSRPALEGEAP